MSASPSRYPRYHLLDPLRGVAICCVMMTHFTVPGDAGSTFRDAVFPVSKHGYLGVALFFLISGYCIAGAAARAAESPGSASRFLFHRFRRIFPPYWWSILLAVALALGTICVGGKTWVSIFPLDLRDWLLNAVLLQGPFGAGDIQLVYWSLTIEIQFYLVVGLILLLPWRIEWMVAFLAVASGLWRLFPSLPTSGTFIAHWGQFSAGMACFYWLYNGHRSRRAATLILLATAVSAALAEFVNPLPYLWWDSLSRPLVDALAVAGAVLLIALHGADERLCRQPVLAWLGWLGMISYSLYLTHNIVGVRVINIGMRLTGLQGLWWLAFLIAAFAFSLAAGILFFRFCEKPWMTFPAAQRKIPRIPSLPLQ
jgi:peptidoglycan/LPS O-acetylase OafA/YrhL